MKMKKLVAMLTTVAMTASILVGCATKKEEGKTPATGDKQVIVGLSTDEGGLNDKSFNQSADQGVKKAVTEFKVKYTPIESKKKEDYQPNLQSLIDNKSNLVIAVGFQMADAVTAVAKNNADAKIAIIDSVVDAPNVASFTFKEEEGSFLMGIIAGKMTKTNKVGFIGGKDFDLINKFEAGFAAGVKAVNPKAAEGLISPDGKAFGSSVKYVDDFADPNKGYEAAKSLYGAGCDVIYHAAGGVGLGMFKAAKELKDSGKEVWAIGVDMDQAVTVPEYASIILSSMIKRVDVATYNASKSVVDGTFKGGVQTLGIKEGGIGIAETTKTNTPADVITLVKDYEKQISEGKLTVPANRQQAKDFTK